MNKRKKSKKGIITAVLFASMLVMSVGTVCFANDEQKYYGISQFGYYEQYDNVSDFIKKDTYSSMVVNCDSSSSDFTVYAVGSTAGTGHQEDYIDASYGNYYSLNEGQTIDDMINSVRESGCCNAGIKGEYSGDAEFSAYGSFFADK